MYWDVLAALNIHSAGVSTSLLRWNDVSTLQKLKELRKVVFRRAQRTVHAALHRDSPQEH